MRRNARALNRNRNKKKIISDETKIGTQPKLFFSVPELGQNYFCDLSLNHKIFLFLKIQL